MADHTAAERQARRRARIAAQDTHLVETVQALVVAVRDLGRKVDNLATPVHNRDVTVGGRDVTVRGRARDAHVREAPAPYGGLGASSRSHGVTVSRSEDLTASVLAVLEGHGANAVAAIRDALGEDHGAALGDVAAALVQLQSRGLVLREEGDQAVQRPDRWRAVDGALSRLEEVMAPPLLVTPSLDLHVTCQDYQAHHAHHAWDAALGTFRCATCSPIAAMAAPSHQGGLTNGHA